MRFGRRPVRRRGLAPRWITQEQRGGGDHPADDEQPQHAKRPLPADPVDEELREWDQRKDPDADARRRDPEGGADAGGEPAAHEDDV
jgi:hypothetical protein